MADESAKAAGRHPLLGLGGTMTITNIAGLGFIAAGLVAVAVADSRR